MFWRIGKHGFNGSCDTAASANTGQGNQPAGEPRRQKIKNIITFSRSPAKGIKPRVFIADHAVGGIDHFIQKQPGKPENEKP